MGEESNATIMDDNLFNQEYTLGNLNEIRFIADIIGRLAVIVISIVGFGIVMSTIFKNSLHGLYAVNPKFWDKVDEAKRASLGFSSLEGGNAVSKLLGTIPFGILLICPNIKPMLDFEDEMLDAKAYFMKALPLACVQIFVGVFIFFGYPAKVAEKFGEFGRGVFDVVLMNTDPAAWVEKLPDKLARVELSTDGSKSDFDKAVNKVAMKVYKSYVGQLDDMTKEKRVEVAKQIEEWVIDEMETCRSYTDTDKYKMTVDSRIQISEPNVSAVDKKKGKNDEYSIARYRSLDSWNHGSAKKVKGSYVRFDVLFTPVAESGGGRVGINCGLYIPSSKVKMNISKNIITVELSGGIGSNLGLHINGTAATGTLNYTVNKESKTMKVTIKGSGKTLTITPKTTNDKIKSNYKIKSVTGIDILKYSAGNYTCSVKSINVEGNKEILKPSSSKSEFSEWSFGTEPTKKKK